MQVIYAIGVNNVSGRIERRSPGVRTMNSMRETGEDAGLGMGRTFSTNTKSKRRRVYNVGPKDREDKSWMIESDSRTSSRRRLVECEHVRHEPSHRRRTSNGNKKWNICLCRTSFAVEVFSSYRC
jgi:hypothetical protein